MFTTAVPRTCKFTGNPSIGTRFESAEWAKMFLSAFGDGRRSVFLRCVVTGTGPYDIALAVLVVGQLDHNPPECAVLLGVGGIVAQRVLIADVMGDAGADGFHLVQRLREVSLSTCRFGEFRQYFRRPLVSAPMDFEKPALVFFAKQPDAIDNRIRLLRLPEQVREGIATCVVFAVADHQDDLFITISELQMIEGSRDRVI